MDFYSLHLLWKKCPWEQIKLLWQRWRGFIFYASQNTSKLKCLYQKLWTHSIRITIFPAYSNIFSVQFVSRLISCDEIYIYIYLSNVLKYNFNVLVLTRVSPILLLYTPTQLHFGGKCCTLYPTIFIW